MDNRDNYRIRIGIDATSLPYQPVGAGNYIINLIRSLSRLSDDIQYVIFTHKSGYELINLPELACIEWWILTDKKPALRLIWEQTVFPLLVKRARLDLLHSPHYTRPAWLPCSSVVTFHDLSFLLYPRLHTVVKRLFFSVAIYLSARVADAIITVSENTRQDALRILKVPLEQVFTVRLGVSEDFKRIVDRGSLRQVQEKYKLPDKYILYVGTIEPRKNISLLLRAFRLIRQKRYSHHLVIVGKLGWMYQEILHLIEGIGLKDYVRFTGYVDSEDLPALYNLAEVLVYPSVYEGFGLPPLEAMACGTPVITSAVSSMPEYISDAGLLIQPNEEALVKALEEVLNKPDLRTHLSSKGIEIAANYSWKSTAENTVKVYRHVLNIT
jgi:glycosyltransferase involved in cell wall biosynthesis